VVTYHNTHMTYIGGGDLGMLGSIVGYWCTDDSEMRDGPNQHNNQLIYYSRDIKVMGPAHSSALDDLITGEDISCCGGVFWGDDTQHTT